MPEFGSMLKEKRRARGLTQEQLSRRLREKAIDLHPSVLSRWETGKRLVGAKDRKVVLAIADVLDMTEYEVSQLLVEAGVAPLQIEDLNLDKILEGLGSERWRKTYFLHKEMKWDEKRIGEKLGIPFWQVRNDIAKREEENARCEMRAARLEEQAPGQPRVAREYFSGGIGVEQADVPQDIGRAAVTPRKRSGFLGSLGFFMRSKVLHRVVDECVVLLQEFTPAGLERFIRSGESLWAVLEEAAPEMVEEWRGRAWGYRDEVATISEADFLAGLAKRMPGHSLVLRRHREWLRAELARAKAALCPVSSVIQTRALPEGEGCNPRNEAEQGEEATRWVRAERVILEGPVIDIKATPGVERRRPPDAESG